MGTGTNLIAHEGMGSSMGIFLKRRYGDGHYGTLSKGYPLPSIMPCEPIYAYMMRA
ncbi:hypothetical protein MTR_7g080910 [Medicago truncatula]|uniref:Uncharacterized protein n=1 Tax=Medicago truncatula TaxID=3880 RepID=G7KSH5_MEDTR|nr:hypothetical protein MTR_7g080910 [Medicago truncatula]